MGLWESLQERLEQTAETVTRPSRVDIVGGGVDEIDPPEDIDEFAEKAKTTGPVRKSLRQFIDDVWEPGYRVVAESDETHDFFMGGENAPDFTPEGGFLANAAIYAGERNQDFYEFGKETTWQRWVRGTILVEKLKQDIDDADSPLTGFHHIRPETVYPQVENNTNILLTPDPNDLPSDIDEDDYELTQRGEVAAYIQFDDESILGLRRNGLDEQEIRLSQNDVMKQVLEPDIGDDYGIGGTQGVFGTSIIEGIADDIAEYENIRRDRATAIATKAYGIWKASFGRDTLELGNQTEIIEWDKEDQDDFTDELGQLEPGEIVTHDGTIDFDKFDSEVPDLVETINQYVSVMLAPLPTPKYMVGFAEGINRDVTGEQNENYQDTVSQERQYQEKKWTQAIRDVAESWDLDTEGLELKLQPEESDNPVKTLDESEIDRMNTYVNTLAVAAGPQAGPTALVDAQELLEVMDFPIEDMDADTVMEDVATEETEAAWANIMGIESLQEFSEGDVVDTPDGIGVVSEIRTEGFTGPDDSEVEASEDSLAYVVALSTEDKTVGVFTESDLSSGDLPETDIEDPVSEIEAMADIADATEYESLQDGFFEWPESWVDSETPARVIALKAWAGMGGRFTGCRREMRGKVSRPNAFCADFKDRILGWEGWRQ